MPHARHIEEADGNEEEAPEDDSIGYTVPLSRTFPARCEAPVVERVAPRIFTLTYFQPCLGCSFCNDSCCAYGVALHPANKERILAHADKIEKYASAPRDRWFLSEIAEDTDFPGGVALDTAVVGRGCAFLRPDARGCAIHAYCIDEKIEYHSLKPIYCSLFPLTVDGGHLIPSCEVDEKSLICVDHGTSLYRGSRDELLYYFGQALVDELDALEQRTLAGELWTV